MGKSTKHSILNRAISNGWETFKEIFGILTSQGNVNKNYIEMQHN